MPTNNPPQSSAAQRPEEPPDGPVTVGIPQRVASWDDEAARDVAFAAALGHWRGAGTQDDLLQLVPQLARDIIARSGYDHDAEAEAADIADGARALLSGKPIRIEFDPAGEIRVDPRPGEGCPVCGVIAHRYVVIGPGGARGYRTCDEHQTRWEVDLRADWKRREAVSQEAIYELDERRER